MQAPSLKQLVCTALTTCLLVIISTTAVTAGGNDFVVGELRVDLTEINQAHDYQLDLLATSGPTTSPNGSYTTTWLAINLDNQTSGKFPQKFTQVGLITDQNAIYWFVYAEPGVSCLRGNINWSDP